MAGVLSNELSSTVGSLLGVSGAVDHCDKLVHQAEERHVRVLGYVVKVEDSSYLSCRRTQLRVV